MLVRDTWDPLISYSLSNYWRIDDFSWGKVRGRSYNYPFSEGDLPDQTRYVRLFFGLKGTGTLWLDDIYFGYSKWNFTALERFRPFFGKQLTLAERILPTPKRFQETGDITYHEVGSPRSHLPVIVLPENPAPAERSAASILQRKISEVIEKLSSAKNHTGSTVSILEKDFFSEEIFSKKMVISIGNNKVYQNVQPNLPLQSIRDNQQCTTLSAPCGKFFAGHTDRFAHRNWSASAMPITGYMVSVFEWKWKARQISRSKAGKNL